MGQTSRNTTTKLCVENPIISQIFLFDKDNNYVSKVHSYDTKTQIAEIYETDKTGKVIFEKGEEEIFENSKIKIKEVHLPGSYLGFNKFNYKK